MPFSKPIFQDLVLTNGEGDFVGLYSRMSKNDEDNSTRTDYYYLPTDASGTPLNSRVNAINGYFDDYETAEADPPDGFGTYTDNYQTRKIVSYFQQFPFDSGAGIDTESVSRTKQEYSTAYAKGATNFWIRVDWAECFKSLTEQTANADSAYSRIKHMADYALSLGSNTTVSFRICTDLDDAILYSGTAFYNLFTDQMQNEMGYPARIAGGSGHVSLAYADGKAMALDFVEKALTYLYGEYGNRLLQYSIGMTAQNEAGYNYENQDYHPVQAEGIVSTASGSGNMNLNGSGTNFMSTFQVGDPIVIGTEEVTVTAIASDTFMATTATVGVYTNSIYYYKPLTPLYQSSFDYSVHAVSGFRTAMFSKYGIIDDLNTAWGESNGSFGVVQPPKTGSSVGGDKTSEQLNNVYSTNKGKDWWKYNYDLLKGYQSDCRQIGIDVAPSAKFVLEWGACTDILSPRRLSLMVCEMDEYSDMMKAQLGILNINPTLALTVDVLRSNYSKKLATELNDHDATSIYGGITTAQIEDYMTQIGIGAIQAGAKEILIISDLKNPSYFNAMMNVLTNVKNFLFSYNGTISTIGTVNYTIGQNLENINQLLSVWQAAGGSNTNRVNMIQSNDYGFGTSGGGEGCQFPLSIYTLHAFCLINNNYKSFPYTNAETSGDSSIIALYNTTRVRFMVPTHSLTYTVSGDLAKSNWRLVGTDGITYISNVQHSGFRQTYDPNIRENNNHPDRRYVSNKSLEDSVYYLPIQNYTIYMTNTGTVNIGFTVEFLDINSNHDSTLEHSQKLTPAMGEQSFSFATSTIPNTGIRQVKINCNRYDFTDGL